MSVPHEYVSHCQSTTYSTVTITACFHATLTCNSCRVFLPNIISTHQIRGRIQIRTYHNCTYHFNYTTVSNQYISIVLVLEGWHKRRGIHYLLSQFIKKGWGWDWLSPIIDAFYKCFEAAGWVSGKDVICKNLRHLSQRFPFRTTEARKSKKPTQVHLQTGC